MMHFTRTLVKRIFLISFLSVLIGAVHSYGTPQITLSIGNCSVGPNYIQWEAFAQNTSTAGEQLWFQSFTIRETHAAAIVPAGTNTYTAAYQSGGEPTIALLFGTPNGMSSAYTVATRQFQTSTSTVKYGNSLSPSNAPWPNLATWSLGIYRLTITNTNWVPNVSVALAYLTTAGVNAYTTATASSATAFNTATNRLFGATCTPGLVTPAPCSITANASNLVGSNCYQAINPTGQADITISGSAGVTSTGTYSVDGGATQNYTTNPFTISGLSNGSHNVSVTTSNPGNPCTATTGSFIIPGPTTSASSIVNVSICNGNSYTFPDGIIYSTINSSTIDTSHFNNAAGCDSIVVTNLTIADTIRVSVNATICSGSTYTFPDGTQTTTSGTHISNVPATGGCDSSITTNLTVLLNTSASPTVFICPGSSYTPPGVGATPMTIAGSTQTTHIANAAGCDSTINTTLQFYVPPSTPTANVTQPTCPTPTGTITVTSPLGVYKYSTNGTTYQNGLTFSGLSPNTYSLTAKDTTTGCVSSAATILVNAAVPPAIPTASVTVQPSCTTATGTIVVTAPTGANILYSIGGAFQVSGTFSGLAPGIYTVRDSDITTKCTAAFSSLTVNNIPANPATPTATVVQPTCLTGGTITVTSPLGSNFQYQDSTGLPFQSSPIFSNVYPGAHPVKVRDLNTGCTSNALSVNLFSPSPPSAPVASVTVQPTCTTPTGTIVVSSPTGANIQYSIGGAYQASTTFSGVSPGTYTVRDSNTTTGCTNSGSLLTVNAAPTIATPIASVTVQPTCTTPTGTIVVTAPTGASIRYRIGGAYQSGVTFSGLAPGTYTVRDSDITTGCTANSILLTVNAVPSIATPIASVTVQPTCTTPTGTIVVTAPTGASLRYSIGGAYQAGVTFSGLAPGTYTVRDSDITTGCTANSILLTVNAVPSIATPIASVTVQPTCTTPTGTIVVTAPTGANILYSIGGAYQAGVTFSGLAPGTYTVRDSDITTGCTANSILLTVNGAPGAPAAPTASVTVQPTCTTPTGTIVVTAPTGANIQYSIGGAYQVSGTFTGVAPGPYSVTAEDISTGCVSSPTSVTVNPVPTPPAAPTASVTIQPTCTIPTGTIDVTAPTGADIQYSIGGAYQVSGTFSGVAPGPYSVTAKDISTGCVSSPTSVTVNPVPTPPAAPTASVTIQPTCVTPTGTIVVTAPTGANIQYSIGGAYQVSGTFSGVAPGPYSVTAKDISTGCISTPTSLTVNGAPGAPAAPTASVTIQPTCTTPTGTIVVTAPTGANIQYSIGGAYQVSGTFTGVAPGPVSVTAKDISTGCVSSVTSLTVDPVPTIAAPTASVTVQPTCTTPTGTIVVTAPTGANIQYSIGGAYQVSGTFTGVAPGPYSVTAKDISTGCVSSPTSVTVNPVPTPPAAPTASVTVQPTCTTPTGTIVVTAPTGANIQYSIGGAYQVSGTFTGVAPGPYSVTAKDISTGCVSSPTSVTVNPVPTPPAAPTASVTVQPTCTTPTGTIVVTAPTGANIQYSIGGAYQVSGTFTGVAPGPYSVTAKDISTGCVSSPTSVTVNPVPTPPAAPTASVTVQPTCTTPTGTIVVTAPTGANIQYSIGGAYQSSSTFTGVAPGPYSVTAKDISTGCVSSPTSVTVNPVPTPPAAPTASVTVQPTCTTPTGTIVVTAPTGANIQYSIGGAYQVSGTFTGVAPGPYSVTAKDISTGCVSSPTSVTVNPVPTIAAPTASVTVQPTCTTPTGTIVVTAPTGANIQYSIGGAYQVSGTFTGVAPGPYSVTAKDISTGCVSSPTSVTVNPVPTPPAAPTASVTVQPTCTTPTGTIVVTAPTGANIQYSIGGAYQVSGTFTGVAPGPYSVTAKDISTGCVSSPTSVTVNPVPTPPAAPTASVTVQPTCTTPTGTIVVTAPTGANIQYSIGGAYQVSGTFTGVAPGPYSVTAKDISTGCVSSVTSLTVNPVPTPPAAPTASVTVQPTCTTPTGTIVVTAPTGANIQYSIGGAYQVSGTFTGVAPGPYSVTAKDISTGCVSSPTSVTVNPVPTPPAAPTASVTVQPTCTTPTGTIVVTAPTGANIQYSIGGAYQVSGTFTGVAPGPYSVTAKDISTGCVSSPTSVTVNPVPTIAAPTASVTVQPTCTTPTGTIVVTAPTGANIQYSIGGAYQVSGTFTGVAPGPYSVTAKDISTGCVSSPTSVTVNPVPTPPAAPTASVTVQPTCTTPTGTIVVTAPTGANIQYSIGGAYQVSGTFTGVAPGPYSVTAKDISTGCVSSPTSVTVNPVPTPPAAPTASVTVQPTCTTPTGTIVVTAPTGANIQYSIGGAYQSSSTFTGVAPGPYSVTAKDISTGCVSSPTSVTVNPVPTPPAAPTASVTVQPTCTTPTGTIVVTAPTGANIQYSIGGAYQVSGTFTGVAPGPYSVTAKDISTGCVSSVTSLTVNPVPTIAAPTASVTVQPTCTTPTGTIVVTAPTGANIQYSIGGAYQVSGTFTGVAPGPYSVTAKDISTGCVSSVTSLTVNPVPTIAAPTASVTVQPTCTTPTGTIVVTAPTGANIQYSIGGAYQVSGTFTGVAPGPYSVTAKDISTGCVSSPTSVTVNPVPTPPAAPTASVTVQPTCTTPTGTIVVTAPTGANIQYSIGGAYQSSSTFTGVAPGPYSVTAKDISTGCVSSPTSVTVNPVPTPPAAPTASVTVQPTCTTPTGTIVVTAPTGANIQYSIGGAYQVSGTFTGVAPGPYSVTAKDISTGCVSSVTSLTVNPVPTIAAPTASVTVQPTCTTPTGTIVVTAPTGANIQYSIGGAYQVSGTFTGVAPGPYSVTAKDISTGCVSSVTSLTVNPVPTIAAPTASVTVQPTCTTPTGTIVVTAPTGANIQYSIGGAYQVSGTFTGVAPGPYSVTAKDISTGCVSSPTSVTVNPVPTIAAPTASVTVQPTCTTPTGTIVVTAPTGANIQYSIGGAYQASGTFTGVAPGPFSVTAKDISTGCISSPTSVTVNPVPTPPAAPTASVTVQPTCTTPTGTIVVTAPTGANIQYSIGGAYQVSGTFTGVAPGPYSVTAKDISTGCVSSPTSVTVNPAPSAPAAPTASVTVQPTCTTPTGTIVVTAPTGANIQYSIGGAYQVSGTFTGVAPGPYSVTAKDISTGCVSSPTSVTVNPVPTPPAAPTASVTVQPTCTTPTGTIVVTAPTGANIQYSIGGAYQASGTFSGVAPGPYSVTAKDISTGCVSSPTSVTVNPVPTPPAVPTASVTVQPTCTTPTGTIVVTAPTGANIQYSIGGAYQVSGTFTGVAPGPYSVTAKDISTGCVSSVTSLTVNPVPTPPAAPTASVTVQPTCTTPTGTIVVTAPTGANIQYSIGGAYQASGTFTGVAPGTYSVTAKNVSNGCVSSPTSVTVNPAPSAPAAPTASVTVQPTCTTPTGTIVVTAPTGANIQYSIGGAYQASGTFTGVAPGPYSVTAKDISTGCVSSPTSVTVNPAPSAPAAPTASVTVQPTCTTPTGTIVVTAPTGANIQYSIGGAYQVSGTFTGVAPGPYSVTAKDNSTGCVSSPTSVTVNPVPTPPAAPTASVTVQPTCTTPTGTIVVTAPTGANIQYSIGGAYQVSGTFTGVAPGPYSVTAKDISTGCVSSPTSVTVNPVPTPPAAPTASVTVQPTCTTPTGTIVVTAPTGANIQYSIGGAYQVSGTFTGVAPGPYSVTAKDISTGCVSSPTSVTVNPVPTPPAAPTASVTVQPTCTTPTGTIVVTAPTGANIQYSIGGAYQVSSTFTGVAPGPYSVTAKDISTGCVSSPTSVTVNPVPTPPAAPTASVTVQPTCTTPTGTIVVTAPTGANIQYSIGGAYQVSGTFTGVAPGPFSVTAKDISTGCVSSPTSVTVNPAPSAPAAPTASVTIQPTCTTPTGTIVVTAPTGANIQYSIGGAYQASGTFTGVAPGPYSVTAKDISTGCVSSPTSVTVNPVPTPPVAPTASVTVQPTCTTPTGTIVVTAPTGANIQYSIGGAYQASGTFTGVAPGPYSVTAKDISTGCVSSPTSVTVNPVPTPPAAPTASVTVQPTCTTPTGTIVVTAPTGANIQYSIGGAYQASGTFTGVAPGTYSVTAKNVSNGCVSSPTSVTVNPVPTPPAAPTASVTIQPTCTTPTGTIVVTAPTGANIQYSIGGAYQVSGTFTGVAPGPYSVTAKDISTGCVSSPTSVTVNPVPTIAAPTASVTVQPTCTTPTGTIVVTAPTGANIQYSIGGAYQVSGTFTGVAPGTYNVTAKNVSNGCVSSPTSVTVNPVPTPPAAPTASVTVQPTCTTPTGTIVVTAPTGANIQYSIGGAYQASGTFTGVAPGTYSVTAKNVSNGCVSSPTSVTVNPVPTPPAAPTASVTVQPTCTTPTGTIVVTAPTGANIQYSIGGAYQASGTFTGVAPGPVSVTAKNVTTGCISSPTSITVNPVPSGTSSTANISICAGQSYTPPGGTPMTTSGTQVSHILNASGCDSAITTILVVNPLPNANAGPDASLNCNTGTVQLNGSSLTSGVSFSWTASNGGHIFSGGNSATPIVDAAGTYTLTVTVTLTGCTASDVMVVSPCSTSTCLISGDTTICENQSTTLCAPAGFASYQWSNGATGSCITVNHSGNYCVTLTSSSGSVSSCCVHVSKYSNPHFTISGDDEICPGQSTTICAPVGYASYLWNNGATTNCITVNSSGNYSVTVTNAAGCTGSSSISVNEIMLPSCHISGNTSLCAGQTTTLCVTAGRGNIYLWNTGATTRCIDVQTPGNYFVTVSNHHGCASSCNVTVTAATPVACSISGTTTICSGQTTTLCGPANASDYDWSNGSHSRCITVSTGGTYSLTVSNSSGCSSTCSVNVTVLPAPNSSITGNRALCLGQSTTLCVPVAGLTSYSWTNGATTNCITVSNPGTYGVTVTNSNNCSSTSSVVVINGTPVNCSISGNTSICQGQATSLCAPNGSGNTYLWNNGVTTRCISVNSPGTYSVTVSNPNGCPSTCSVTVTNGGTVSSTITGNTSICQGQTTTLSAPSGYASYHWSNGATTGSIDVGCAGTYSVTVTNSGGCSSTSSVCVTIIPGPSTCISGNTSICQGSSTVLTASANCTSYLWNTGATTRSITVNYAGTFTVTVTNSAGCSATGSVCVHIVNCNSGCSGNTRMSSGNDGNHGMDASVYPNPFNVSTTVEFINPESFDAAGLVEIYSLDGRKVAELFNGTVKGNTTYRIKWDAGEFADGTYMYRIICGDQVSTGRIVLMKE